ncbi:F0F1 ATP synthase subunit alpha [Capillibacterium thermochitinicola]|nr:F0F1 ATP synthase subunit alpha [Capillibacterium thermochitinicola]
MKLISGGKTLKQLPSTPYAPPALKSGLELTAVTPVPLEEEEEALLKQRLTEITGKRPRIHFETSSRLLAGMILRTKDRDLDGSVGRQLRRLRRILLEHDLRIEEQGAPSAEWLLNEFKGVVDQYQAGTLIDDIGTVLQYGDGVALITGMYGAHLNEVVKFQNGSYGMVLNLETDQVGAIVFGEGLDIHSGDAVRLLGRTIDVPVGEELIGRVVNPLGEPIDGLGPIHTTKRRPVEAPAPGIAERSPVDTPLQTGIKVIDALIPIGRGQRELIIGDRQTGKTALAIDTILNQKETGVLCVYVAIGQKAATVAQVIETLKEHGAMDYTIVVVASAADTAPVQYLAPYSGCAMAEEFMYQGKDVLIVYDDLSKHAVAYRAMSLLLRRPPGREAYPGDIFYLHARLLERAARLSPEHKGGSLTALPIVETLEGDISAYIPTNIISITDGQIFLDTDLFLAGFRPAVNVGLSVSRVGGDAQIPAMKKLAGPLRLQLAQYRELTSFTQFGAELDQATRDQLAKGERIAAVLKQPRFSPIPVAEQVVTFYMLVNGYFDDMPVERIPWFEAEVHRRIRQNHPDLFAEITTTGHYQEVEDRLRSTLQEIKTELASTKPQAETD